jgi:uracil-DNA glycosylase
VEPTSLTPFPEIDGLLKTLWAFDDALFHRPDWPAKNRHRMVPTKKVIGGQAFFPGDSGLLGQTFPFQQIMVLGHDFDTRNNFETACEVGHESEGNDTWRSTLALFGRVGINKEQCFFTNAYMGVRTGRYPNGKCVKPTGVNPSRSHKPYANLCATMFEHQIGVQQPKLVIALGTYVPPFLAKSAPATLGAWKQTSFEKRDKDFALAIATFPAVCPDGSIGDQTCVVASILHPSMRDANLDRRSYEGLTGDKAEVKLLGDALERSGLK